MSYDQLYESINDKLNDNTTTFKQIELLKDDNSIIARYELFNQYIIIFKSLITIQKFGEADVSTCFMKNLKKMLTDYKKSELFRDQFSQILEASIKQKDVKQAFTKTLITKMFGIETEEQIKQQFYPETDIKIKTQKQDIQFKSFIQNVLEQSQKKASLPKPSKAKKNNDEVRQEIESNSKPKEVKVSRRQPKKDKTLQETDGDNDEQPQTKPQGKQVRTKKPQLQETESESSVEPEKPKRQSAKRGEKSEEKSETEQLDQETSVVKKDLDVYSESSEDHKPKTKPANKKQPKLTWSAE